MKIRMPKMIAQLLLSLLLQMLATGTIWATSSNPDWGLGPSPARGHQSAEHVQREPLRQDRIPPLPSSNDHLFEAYDQPTKDIRQLQRERGSCNVSDFAQLTGQALVDAVSNADFNCISLLFRLTGAPAGATFNEAKMLTIANAVAARAEEYPGNNSTKLNELIYFLRAGYYVQFYNNAAVGNYGPSLGSSVRAGLDHLSASPNFLSVNDEHGWILQGALTLIHSASFTSNESMVNHYQMIPRLLSAFDPEAWLAHQGMTYAINQVFFLLYASMFNAPFQQYVQGAGSAVVQDLSTFVHRTHSSLAETENEYLLTNAARELARFLRFPPSFPRDVRLLSRNALQLFELGVYGSRTYVGLGVMIDYYDRANCAYYGICGFAQRVENFALPNTDYCPNIGHRLRHKGLTPAQVTQSCASVENVEEHFHDMLATDRVPVANDNNALLEMVAFDSAADYQAYSGFIFGNDTNNGGIYLEGNPADPNNQPRFIAYRTSGPNFQIWNLEHEFVHYLDGRYNMHGRFSDYPTGAPNSLSSVWYIEGVAELVSLTARGLTSAGALSQAASPDLFSFTELLGTIYNHSSARIYSWGYLASRFAYEQERPAFEQMLGHFRIGNYTPGYQGWVQAMGGESIDSRFRAWVACFRANNGDTTPCDGQEIFTNSFEPLPPPPECPDPDLIMLGNGCTRSNLAATSPNPLWLATEFLPAGTTQLRFEMAEGSGRADLYVRAGTWPTLETYDYAKIGPGTTASITIPQPQTGDYYYVMIHPESSFSGVRIMASWVSTPPAAKSENRTDVPVRSAFLNSR